MNFKSYIRDVPDFPKKGIIFRDISPLLAAPHAWAMAVDELSERAKQFAPDMLAGIDARGFLIAAPLSYKLGVGFSMVRKKGKLPWDTIDHIYELEYGTDQVELHADAFPKGAKVLICDDLLATGGTAFATKSLIEKCGGHPVGLLCLIELEGLGGREKLMGLPVSSLIHYA